MEYSSNGKGNLGVTLGAIGTGLGALGSSGILQGFGMGGAAKSDCINREEFVMAQELASKDAEIALLKSEGKMGENLLETYKLTHSEVVGLREYVDGNVKELQEQINVNRREQDAWNAAQNVSNAQMSAAIATNTNSISAIQGIIGQITETKVPNSAVCPGWGTVAVSTVSSGTTVA